MAALDEALALCQTSGEAQDLCPLYAARAETAWLAGDVDHARNEAAEGIGRLSALSDPAPFWRGELAFWAWKGGSTLPMPEEAAGPYRLHRSGRYVEAASAWGAIGCPYHEGLALADSRDERDLRRALQVFQSLGAEPMSRLVRRRLRELGARGIKVGPRARTRRNPAGLTDREVEVLDLLSHGLRNSDIAGRLVLSTKTVDHHVSAILRKLDVTDRGAAATEARRFALKDGEVAASK
jgi:DNA-binding CsgD family transcriptional regulator